MQEKNVGKIAEMLLAGDKMLSLHCATCRSPLFEHEGKVVCPICGEKAEAAKSEVKPAGEVECIMLDRLDQLAKEFKEETDRHAAAELLELMKSILEVLEKLKVR